MTAVEIERVLRLEWWLNHGHARLYGNDGEMQCTMCPADFKRQPLGELELLVAAARSVAMLPGESAAACPTVTPHDRGGPFPNLPSGHHQNTAQIIQRARGMLADGADSMLVGNYVAAYAVLIPLPKRDIGTIIGYLLKTADSKARSETIVEQRKIRAAVQEANGARLHNGNGSV